MVHEFAEIVPDCKVLPQKAFRSQLRSFSVAWLRVGDAETIMRRNQCASVWQEKGRSTD
jgi:hypothetical protein